jgi:hypothetical protein
LNGRLAIPVDLYEYIQSPANPWDMGTHTFSGLYVYQVSMADGFTMLGRIDTMPGLDQFYSSWLRGVFMGDTVFAVDSTAVRCAQIEDIPNTISMLCLGHDSGRIRIRYDSNAFYRARRAYENGSHIDHN